MRMLPVPDKWLSYSVRRELLDVHLEEIRDRMTGRVLEIGNGRAGRRGAFRPPEASAEVWYYLDHSAHRRPDVLADAMAMPFAPRSFDTVLCLETLEYLEDPRAAVAEMRRVLSDRGRLILSAPFFHRCDAESDRWRFTARGLETLLESADFVIETTKRQGAALATVSNTIQYILYVMPDGRMRNLLSWTARPLLRFLRGLDHRLVDRMPALEGFSTGYLVLARTGKGG